MASEETTTRHKSGPLKQQNKTHKHGRHRSKSEIDKNNKGTVTLLSLELYVSCVKALIVAVSSFTQSGKNVNV